MAREFIKLHEVAETLGISGSQVYALVRSGELRAVKIGGRGQWRVEVAELTAYIQAMYTQTAAFVAAHPYGPNDTAADEPFDTPQTRQEPLLTSDSRRPQPPQANTSVEPNPVLRTLELRR